jgi:hypothetical protein
MKFLNESFYKKTTFENKPNLIYKEFLLDFCFNISMFLENLKEMPRTEMRVSGPSEGYPKIVLSGKS